jgi:hypothetical protein
VCGTEPTLLALLLGAARAPVLFDTEVLVLVPTTASSALLYRCCCKVFKLAAERSSEDVPLYL